MAAATALQVAARIFITLPHSIFRTHNPGNGIDHLLLASLLGDQLLPARGRKAIELGALVALRQFPFSLYPALLFQAMDAG